MQNRQIDNKKTKQIRIDAEVHRLLKIKAAEEKTTVKKIIEQIVEELLGITPIT